MVDVPGLDDNNPFAYLVVDKVSFPALCGALLIQAAHLMFGMMFCRH